MIPIVEGFQLADLEMGDAGKLKRITIGLRLLLIKNNYSLKQVVSKVSYISICFGG